MQNALHEMGGVVTGLSFDQVAAAALLGVIVTGIVSWGNSIVSYWGLRKNVEVIKAEKRAAVDLRNPGMTQSAAGFDFTIDIVNLGQAPARNVEVVPSGGPGVWFAVVGPGESLPLVFQFGNSANSVEIEVTHDDGMGEVCSSRTIFSQVSGGAFHRKRGENGSAF